MAVTEIQKRVYNEYLRVIAIASNRPYRARVKFDKIDDSTAKALRALEMRFTKHTFIDIRKYFETFMTYMGANYLSIDKFVGAKPFRVYMRLVRANEMANEAVEDEDDSVDELTDEELAEFKEGLKFIVKWCKENNVEVKGYTEQTNDMFVPFYMLHLQEKRINMLHLHLYGLGLFEIPRDYCEIVVNDFVEKFVDSQQEFERSKKLCALRVAFRKEFF